MKKYWYYTEIWTCVLCGAETKYKERKYTPKPENSSDRIIYHEDACNTHFI